MDINLFLQSASDIFNEDFSTGFKIISYIITVVIGGVIYKYFNRWLEYSSTKTQQQQTATDNLVGNMEQRIKELGERITDLESKREQSYQRELEVTKMLAKAEQKVETLEDKVQTLERNQKVLERTVDKYYKKYGPLNEIN